MDLQQAKEYAKANMKKRADTSGRLNGKLAVITGSAQGFGLGIAKAMYAQGASVVIADLPSQSETAKAVVDELGQRSFFCPVDGAIFVLWRSVDCVQS